LIIDTAYDAFLAMDAAGAIADWNHQAELTFGWRREEIVGRPVAETINDYSHDTGITAAVNEVAHTLTFTIVDYGSSAIADIDVVSGSFVVAGGDGAGHDAGTNAGYDRGTTIDSSSGNVSGNRFT
jgi:PAS domain-containing protein